MVATVKGYPRILVRPESMSSERRRLNRAYGAKLVLTPRAQGMKGSIAKAQELVLTMSQNLEYENQALLRGDSTIPTAVDHGDRRIQMHGLTSRLAASGPKGIERHTLGRGRVHPPVPRGPRAGREVGREAGVRVDAGRGEGGFGKARAKAG